MNRIGSYSQEHIGSMNYRTIIRSYRPNRPNRPSTRRLIAAAAVAVAGCAIAPAAYAAPRSPAAHAAPIIRLCAGGSDLRVWLVATRGRQLPGTTAYTLEFKNTGSYTCSLSGYPDVSAVTKGGSQLGSPAGRGALTVIPLVVLAPGGLAHTTLVYHSGLVSAARGCGPVTKAFELRVREGAGSNRAMYTGFGFGACSRSGHVYLTITEPIKAGAGTNSA
jgi:hypothetical protein